MSNVLSIAAVTAVIKDLLENGLVSDAIVSSMGDVVVTALPPDRVSVEADERPQLNLFLYQISPNRNADWSANTADKLYARSTIDRTAMPPLALDLYYLVTAYGAKDFQAELLLGYAIDLLYKIPMLNSDRIEVALSNATKVSAANVFSQSLAAISTAELAHNLGQLKISSEFLSLDEMSRLWSLFQTHYRPSTAYRVSMVAMPERQEYQPVGAKVSASIPQIDRVTSIGDRSITTDNILLIRGQNLRGEITRIRLGNKETILSPQDVTPTQISLKLPPHLTAGIQGVQILHSAIISPDLFVESNLASFVLQPQIAATVTKIDGENKDVRNAEIAVKFSPRVNRSQQVSLLLYRASDPQAVAYAAPANLVDTDTDLLTFNLSNLAIGNYLVQARVDGAASLAPTELTDRRFGKHDGMQVVIQ
jgi:Pvc16 N-terminal domain